jgi:uncharacterized membrane protein YeaQ/YmgE (transglycosylase-associated protein family)
MIGNIISFLFGSFVVGLCGRALMPGKNNMPITHTMLLGATGTFVGNLLGSILTGRSGTGSFVGSVVGAIIALWAWNRFGDKKQTGNVPRYQ